jgi:GDP-L-fucose synthase
MKNNSRILIFGGNGLVGSSFFYGQVLNRSDVDLTDYNQVVNAIEKYKPDWVINCAGFVGGVQANMDFQWDFFKINTLINMNVIEACMNKNVPNLISFLSTCIFPDEIARSSELVEGDLHDGEPHESNYPYAYSKRMTDIMSRIAREKGFNYRCLIPTNLYGFNDNYNLKTSHIIPALIHKFYLAYQKSISENKPQSVEIWGSGNPLREFIYANDIPILINQIINKNINFDNLILSPDNAISIKELAQTINNIFALKYLHTSADVSIYFNTDKPDGQHKKSTDNSKLKELIDFKFTPLKEGLIQSIDYFTDKYENDRNSLRL